MFIFFKNVFMFFKNIKMFFFGGLEKENFTGLKNSSSSR